MGFFSAVLLENGEIRPSLYRYKIILRTLKEKKSTQFLKGTTHDLFLTGAFFKFQLIHFDLLCL